MVGFLERLFGRDGNSKAGTGKLAKDRLQLVLVKDRINLPTEKLRQMEREIIEVISKYVSVDMENVDFNLSNRDRTGLLIAEIPFIAVAEDTPGATRAAEDDEDDETLPVPQAPLAEAPPPPPNPLADGAATVVDLTPGSLAADVDEDAPLTPRYPTTPDDTPTVPQADSTPPTEADDD